MKIFLNCVFTVIFFVLFLYVVIPSFCDAIVKTQDRQKVLYEQNMEPFGYAMRGEK